MARSAAGSLRCQHHSAMNTRISHWAASGSGLSLADHFGGKLGNDG